MVRRIGLILLTIGALISIVTMNTQAQAQSLMTRHVREAVLDGQALSVGRLPATQSMQLNIVLPLRNQAELDNFLRELSDPSSGMYRRFLTVPEFTERFGPTQADYDAVVRFAKANGFTVVGGTRDGMDVQIKGPVSAIEAAFQLTPEGQFRYRWIRDAATGHNWSVPENEPSSPIDLTVDSIALDGNTAYTLQSYSFAQISTPAAGVRFSIKVKPASASGQIEFEADIYNGQPFLRYRTAYENLGASPSFVTQADMLAWKFQDGGQQYQDFFVNQWNAPRGLNFEPHETNLSASGPVEMQTGANADHAAWRALRDGNDNGLIAAWEFDGRASADVNDETDTGVLTLDAQITGLNHQVNPNEMFHVPDAFVGVYHGDWDEAGYRTQRFADTVLAVPLPDPHKFPYAMFDTWGYGENIDEATVMHAAQLAATAGAEVFILDFGWARGIGDWYPDPVKFPDGIKPISDYVHSLGMKFGLHIPFLEAAANSPVLLAHPDWEAVKSPPHQSSHRQ